MKNISLKTSLILLLLTFISCGPSQKAHDKLLLSNKNLKEKIDSLSEELSKYKFTPKKIFAPANLLYKEKKIKELSKIANQLRKYHPESKEYTIIQKYIHSLQKEKEAKIKAEKQLKMRAVKRLKKNFDDVSGITWYKNPYFRHYSNTNHVSLYIGKQDNNVWLRLMMSYKGDDWIFFENAYLSYDGNTLKIPFNKYKDKTSDNDSGVWEWIDVVVTDSTLSFLKELVKGKSLKMRLSGKYSKTKRISATERKAMRDVLLGYEVLVEQLKQ